MTRAIRMGLLLSGLAGAGILSGCSDPAAVVRGTVTVDGTVTGAWGVPLVPFKMYKVDDGTGEITVLSRGGNRTPVRGSHVKVKGVVRDVAVFNGMPLGLHLEERDLDIRRN